MVPITVLGQQEMYNICLSGLSRPIFFCTGIYAHGILVRIVYLHSGELVFAM